MTKKILCMILAILILAGGVLTGCSNEANNAQTTEATEMAIKNDGVLNLLMVSVDLGLYFRNRRLDRKREAK